MSQQSGEHRVLFPNVGVGRIGKGTKTFRILLVLREHLQDFGRLFISRWLEEHGINQAENSGVGSDTECEHGDRGDGETGRFPELANGEPKVLDHISYSARKA